MEFNMEWNVICRVCLQEGEMRSIYDKEEKDVTICEKIIKCSNVTIKRGMNLPEQICSKCLEDLHTAYKFRTNCESSDAILQTFIEGQSVTDLIVSSESGEIYKYKPPQGLNVKRIRPMPIKYELSGDENQTGVQIDQNNLQNRIQDALAIGVSSQNALEEQQIDIDDHFIDADEQDQCHIKEHISEDEDNNHLNYTGEKIYVTEQSKEEAAQINSGVVIRTKNSIENQFEFSENGKICTIKPVKTNKARSKVISPKEKLRVVAATEISTKPDGTTVIRVRRNIEEPKPLKICEICGNTYKYKHTLESHMRRHRNEKPFSCEICGRSFVINFELRRHMRTHTGQKPYACQYCGRKFSDFGSRIKHERTHTGERPYSCETCGKSFTYSHVLSSHILTHTGEKRFGCNECGKRFAKSHHLKAHLNTHIKNKSIILTAADAVITKEEISEKDFYHADNNTYQEAITVLKAQPKIENFADDEDIKAIYATSESQHSINAINMRT